MDKTPDQLNDEKIVRMAILRWVFGEEIPRFQEDWYATDGNGEAVAYVAEHLIEIVLVGAAKRGFGN